MQIQRTGYQQNFGTAVPIKSKNLKFIEKLLYFDKSDILGWRNTRNPECRIDYIGHDGSFHRGLLTDGDEANDIRAKVNQYLEIEKDRPSLFQFMRELYESLAAKSEPIEISSDEDILNIPILQKFRLDLLDYFERVKW